MATFNKGNIIPLISDCSKIEIIDYIAEGGQGEVYRVKYKEQEYALKWYSKLVPSDKFYNNLEHNIRMGAPNENYLWPLAITAKVKGSFGYIMKLRPKEFMEYGDFLLGIVRFKSWAMLLKASLNIVESFFILHSIGYSYQDLNEGSFFINPENGNVLICDNDNVAPFGENLGVKGMAKYMAPEVLLNKVYPNTHTDRFSLAIILFRLFYIDHPLEGQYTIKFPLTDAIGAKIFGENPIFVYDPNNPINKPHPEVHTNVIRRWTMFPPDITLAFTKAFTKGLKDINCRKTEAQWKEILVKARGMLVCIDGKEKFVNGYLPKSVPQECKLLRTEEQIIVLASESPIYMCQIDRTSLNFNTQVGIVKTSNLDKRVLGLCNLTENDWTVYSPDNQMKKIAPKSFVPLLSGVIIDFGNIKGKIF